VRRNFNRTLERGYALISAGAFLVILMPKVFAIPAIGIYGLGLGMAMTSNSMLIGRIFPQRRGSALSVLNFCWSLGATLCPLVIARIFGPYSLNAICAAVALLAAPFVLLPRLGRFAAPPEDPRPGERSSEPPVTTIAYFALLAFLYVGIESSTGNWMTTYTSRVVAWNFTRSNLATASFWAALLLGRGIAPLILLGMAEKSLYLLSIVTTAIAGCLLVAAHSGWLLLVSAVLAGVGLAPVFPLTLSFFMAKAGNSPNVGWVFAVAGFGGAVLPWLTGVVSSTTHSLRIGLLVPAFAAIFMLFLAEKLSPAGGAQMSGALPVKPVPGRA
jgi:MFS transporter, FHS family, glucose/mannose:H+ symporter